MVTLFAFLMLVHLSAGSSCASGQFFDTVTQSCVYCNSNCLTCNDIPSTSSMNCLSCSPGRIFLSIGDCVPPCELNLSCLLCLGHCNTCGSLNKAECGSCKKGYVLYNNTCSLNCPSTNFYTSNGQCFNCDLTCATCAGAGQTGCTTCNSPYLPAIGGGCYLQICGDGHVVGTEQCDNGVNAPGSSCVKCQLATPCTVPQFLSAQWNLDFSAFTVWYSENVESRVSGCGMFQEAAVLGVGAECTVYGSEMRVQLGDNPRLTFPLILHLVSDSFVGVYCPYIGSPVVIVQVPASQVQSELANFDVEILGPSSLSPCDSAAHFVIQPSLAGVLASLTSVTWAVAMISEGAVVVVDELTALAQGNSADWKTWIPPPALPGSYSISVQCTSGTGQKAQGELLFTKKADALPSLRNLGFRNLTIPPEEMLTFRADLDVNLSCLGVQAVSEVAVLWELKSASERENELAAQVRSNTYENILVLPSYFLEVGETVYITITAWLSPLQDAKVQEEFSVMCIASELVAIISPPQVLLGSSEDLYLDARDSYRLGAFPDFRFLWTCANATGAFLSLPISTESNITIPGGQLRSGRYYCTVIVTDTTGSASATALIDVMLQPFAPAHSSLHSSLNGKRLVNSHTTVLWLRNDPSEINTVSVAPATSAAISANDMESRIWLARTDVPLDNLTVTVATDTTVLELDLLVETQPYGGRLTVTPQEGIEFLTEFRLTADDWEDGVLKYQFMYEDPIDGWVALTDALYSNSITLKLPQGPGNDFTLSVAVKVFTDSEACTTQIAVIICTPWQTGYPSTANKADVLNDYFLPTQQLTSEEVVRSVSLLSSILSAPPTSGFNCTCLNLGKCVQNHCVCATGWAGYDCGVTLFEAALDEHVFLTLGSQLLSVIVRLPPTPLIFENTLRSIWALYQHTDLLPWELDDSIIRYLAAESPFQLTDWLYSNVSLIPTPLTIQSAEKLAHIAAVSLDLLASGSLSTPENVTWTDTQVAGSLRIRLLEDALRLLGLRIDFPNRILTTVVYGSFGLPVSQNSIINVTGLSLQSIALELSQAEEPVACAVIETSIGKVTWGNESRLTSVVSLTLTGQWTQVDASFQTVELVFKGNFSKEYPGQCADWNGLSWSNASCETTISADFTSCTCNCSSGKVFSVLLQVANLPGFPLSESDIKPTGSVHSYIPLYCFGGICTVGICLMIWGRVKDMVDEEVKAKAAQNVISASSAELVNAQGEVMVESAPPAIPTATENRQFLTTLKNCHYALSIFYRFDHSLSRPARVFLYVVRLTTISSFALVLGQLSVWGNVAGTDAFAIVGIQAVVYPMIALFLRLLKAYPEDNVAEVSIDPKVNLVKTLKHSPQMKLFERREEAQYGVMAIVPFSVESGAILPEVNGTNAPHPQTLKQPELRLSKFQRCRVMFGMLLSIGVLALSAVVHVLLTEEVEPWELVCPVSVAIDFALVQPVLVTAQVLLMKFSGGCPLLSRTLSTD